MYRGRANAVVYFFLCLSILIVGVLVYKQVQFSYGLKQAVTANGGSYFSVKGLKEVIAMNQVSLRVFFFTFVCFLVVLISLLMVLQSTEKAYKLTNEANVRYTVKMAYPAIVLAVIGCFFLALSIYRSSDLQMNTSDRLADQKKYQIVLDSLFNEKMALEQDIAAGKEKKAPPAVAAVQQHSSQAAAAKAPALGSSQHKTREHGHADTHSVAAIAPKSSPVVRAAKTVKPSIALKEEKRSPATIKSTSSAKPVDKQQSGKDKVAAAPAAKPAEERKEEPATSAVTAQEIQYAGQLQRQATIYGHYPTSSELNAYNSIYKRLEKNDGQASASFNKDLHWAFDLLQRTKQGYQPTPQELVRYEQTVQRNLDISETFESRLR